MKYGPVQKYGIEVYHQASYMDRPEWELKAVHNSLNEALNDLRWESPNRVVGVLVDTQRSHVLFWTQDPIV